MQSRSNLWQLVILALALTTFTLTSCDDDDDIKPTTATIKGVITFDNVELWDTWQDSGEVQLSIFPEFSLDPLAGWGEVPDNFFGPGAPSQTSAVGPPAFNPIVVDYQEGSDQYAFELEIQNIEEPVTFSAIAIGIRHDFIQDPTRRSATLGVWWDNENEVSHGIVIRPAIGAPPIFDYPAPESFTVEPGDEIELNLKADWGFVEDWYN